MVLLFLLAAALFPRSTPHVLPTWALGPFDRPTDTNPIISPRDSTFLDPMSGKQVAWEINDTFNPAATVKNGKVVVLYRAEDTRGVGIGQRTSRIGYGESSDGLHFKRLDKPVLYPAEDDQKSREWPGGCEDPRVVMDEKGTYYIFYTQYSGPTEIGVATSKDLVHWQKHGFIFQNHNYRDSIKSASPVTKVEKGRLVLARIHGKYWMYFGEEGVYVATSDDGIDWTPLKNPDGSPLTLIRPRKGFFDSSLTECGPPSVLTDKGIILIYNGKNDGKEPQYSPGAYCAGQALFSKDDPTKLVDRLDEPFFVPSAPFEKTGQYAQGTVFTEGLVWFHKEWFLYYGAADSRVAVAVYDPKWKKH